MKLKIFIISIFSLGLSFLPAYGVAALPLFDNVCDQNNNQSSVCDDAGRGPGDQPSDNPLYGPEGIITIAVNLLSIVVGIAAVIGIIVAGIKYLTSASNPEEANLARELIIYAVVGLILATVAQVMVRTVLNNITL